MVYPQDKEAFHWQEIVVITCPEIKNLKTNAFYTLKGKKVNSTETNHNYSLTLQGFKQANLNLQQDKASAVNLSGNSINRLDAIVGWSTLSNSRLQIDKTNSIQEADLDIRNESELIIENVKIPKLKYQFSDSARVTFSGSALGVIAQ
ncbi:hypothetical protein AHMF7605_02785 [Adhaeribacter arboris]|uniref:Uncharacterized protein n=1 Tax=Adhaeribacter arboris TaxID=2072846 RepID=A0A2T2YAI2_9BACT|nr:hypothetical protein [Adhaeribacter arboris]PSR52525.1 hypothetical protein AHMF7605_02785 [Adhaeribacter arboris]